MDSIGHFFMTAVLWMKACAIPDYDMLILRILHFDLFEKNFRPVRIYTGSLLHEHGFPIDRIKCTVAIAPFIFALPRLVRAESFECPYPAQVWQQAITAFVGKP